MKKKNGFMFFYFVIVVLWNKDMVFFIVIGIIWLESLVKSVENWSRKGFWYVVFFGYIIRLFFWRSLWIIVVLVLCFWVRVIVLIGDRNLLR